MMEPRKRHGHYAPATCSVCGRQFVTGWYMHRKGFQHVQGAMLDPWRRRCFECTMGALSALVMTIDTDLQRWADDGGRFYA